MLKFMHVFISFLFLCPTQKVHMSACVKKKKSEVKTFFHIFLHKERIGSSANHTNCFLATIPWRYSHLSFPFWQPLGDGKLSFSPKIDVLDAHVCADPKARGGREGAFQGGEGFWVARGGEGSLG